MATSLLRCETEKDKGYHLSAHRRSSECAGSRGISGQDGNPTPRICSGETSTPCIRWLIVGQFELSPLDRVRRKCVLNHPLVEYSREAKRSPAGVVSYIPHRGRTRLNFLCPILQDCRLGGLMPAPCACGHSFRQRCTSKIEEVASSAVSGESPSKVETLGDGQSENLRLTHYPVIQLTVTSETVTPELAEDL